MNQEALAKLTADLKKFKDEEPERYLELLKALNQGIEAIASDLKKSVRQ